MLTQMTIVSNYCFKQCWLPFITLRYKWCSCLMCVKTEDVWPSGNIGADIWLWYAITNNNYGKNSIFSKRRHQHEFFWRGLLFTIRRRCSSDITKPTSARIAALCNATGETHPFYWPISPSIIEEGEVGNPRWKTTQKVW